MRNAHDANQTRNGEIMTTPNLPASTRPEIGTPTIYGATTHSGATIDGIGESPRAAVREAVEAIGGDEYCAGIRWGTALMSPALVAQVEAEGGNIAWGEIDGTWVTVEEELEYHDSLETRLEAAAEIMDDDLREQVHSELAPCRAEQFLVRYCELHERKFGVAFAMD